MKKTMVSLLMMVSLAGSAVAAEIKVVTEYRYPTSYEVTPIMGMGPNGAARVVGGIVTPTDFKTREVGCVMSVYAEVGMLAGVVAMADGMKLINNNTDLMMAATSGELDATKRLLAKGAPVDARNRFGSTALLGAAAGGFDKIVRLLLDNKADVNSKSNNGSTPLLFAAKNGHLPAVQMLLDKGAYVNAADSDGLTPLLCAVNGGYADVAKLLIERGASTEIQDRSGSTPLMLAQAKNYRDIVVLLTRVGAKK